MACIQPVPVPSWLFLPAGAFPSSALADSTPAALAGGPTTPVTITLSPTDC